MELAAIVLIFTSQAWNMTFGWYQSLTTIPVELREASSIFRLNGWMRFKRLELPFATIGLIWNSIMSWAGGWFFLMAAEIFTVGSRDFRLPGLGAYLQEAANQGNTRSILFGLGALILTIVALDQFIWRPLLAWSDRFKVETVESDQPPTSWFYDLVDASSLFLWARSFFGDLSERFDRWMIRRSPMKQNADRARRKIRLEDDHILYYHRRRCTLWWLPRHPYVRLDSTGDNGDRSGSASWPPFCGSASPWLSPCYGRSPLASRSVQTAASATVLQPIVQVTAAIPATAIFPIILLFFINVAGGLNIAAIFLMLMGTQWYLLFNIIAGASAIPQDLKYTSSLLQLYALGKMAHPDPAFPVSLYHHRRHHGQRRRLECEHRGGICSFWGQDLIRNGHRLVDLAGNGRRGLSVSACLHFKHDPDRSAGQPPVLEANV